MAIAIAMAIAYNYYTIHAPETSLGLENDASPIPNAISINLSIYLSIYLSYLDRLIGIVGGQYHLWPGLVWFSL